MKFGELASGSLFVRIQPSQKSKVLSKSNGENAREIRGIDLHGKPIFFDGPIKVDAEEEVQWVGVFD